MWCRRPMDAKNTESGEKGYKGGNESGGESIRGKGAESGGESLWKKKRRRIRWRKPADKEGGSLNLVGKASGGTKRAAGPGPASGPGPGPSLSPSGLVPFWFLQTLDGARGAPEAPETPQIIGFLDLHRLGPGPFGFLTTAFGRRFFPYTPIGWALGLVQVGPWTCLWLKCACDCSVFSRRPSAADFFLNIPQLVGLGLVQVGPWTCLGLECTFTTNPSANKSQAAPVQKSKGPNYCGGPRA